MKIKHVEKLLDSMNRNNKHYLFVQYMLSMGHMRALVHPEQVNKLKKLMDKKGIDYRPKFWEWDRYIRLLKFWWWMIRPSKTDYSGLSRTTYSEDNP